MKPTQILDSAIKLLELNDWNKGQYALDKDKNPIPWTSLKATSYCLQGALMRICHLNKVSKKSQTETALAIRSLTPSLTRFNDVYLNTKEEAIEFLKIVKTSLKN